MKSNSGFAWSVIFPTVIVAVTALASMAHAQEMGLYETVEVPVNKVFIPAQGYDDNDNVGIVVDGTLPNYCYRVGQTKIENGDQPGTFRVRQYAIHDTNGACAQDANLPAHMAATVPFTVEASLGTLDVGKYSIQFRRDDTASATRAFSIEHAKAVTVDDHPYALVTASDLTGLVVGGGNTKVQISGLLTTSCTDLSGAPRVWVQGDVIVVLPIVTRRPDVMCAEILRPFTTTVALGNLAEGRYLLHVRTMNGRAFNRAFTVVRPDPAALR